MTEEYGDKPWKSESLVRQLYWEKRLSIHEIADQFGCMPKTVRRWMKKHDIDRRSLSNAVSNYQIRGPTHYRTKPTGYEEWAHTRADQSQKTVRVHRLAAVAWFGLNEVKNNVVHHKNTIPWDNRQENLKTMRHSEHSSMHMSERVEKMQFDENGNISGWSK